MRGGVIASQVMASPKYHCGAARKGVGRRVVGPVVTGLAVGRRVGLMGRWVGGCNTVGCGVGYAVGIEVGSDVGRAVGRDVGRFDGWTVGDGGRCVGCSEGGCGVGCPVGRAVGLLVGRAVARDVGRLVGWCDTVGCSVGPDGRDVGCRVGADGRDVGRPVGCCDTVGFAVGVTDGYGVLT